MHKLALYVVVIASAACRSSGAGAPGAAPTPAVSSAPGPCDAGDPTGTLPRNLSVIVTGPPVPGRPAHPGTRAEQMVIGHLYETLIRTTCDGHIVPGLAESWTSADSGRRWTFTLRRFARFWDGTPVLASHVLTSWAGYNAPDVSLPWAGIAQARAVDDRTIAVRFENAMLGAPAALSDPRLAVSIPARGPWPHGSGPYRPGYEDSSIAVIDAWDSGIPGAGELPRSIEFHTVQGSAARDLLDRGIDILVTDDRSLLDYASSRGQLITTAMPWDRAYVLFVPDRPGLDPPTQRPAAGFLEAMAAEAVEVDARVAGPDAAWRADSCGTGTGTTPDFTSQPRRVVYPGGDETARALAHRLVTFAGAPGQGGDWLAAAFRNPPGGRTFPFAVGLEPAAWSRALEGGSEVAFVLAAPARPLTRCAPPRRPDGATMILIETRAHLGVRPGLGGLQFDWDGTLQVRGVR